MTPIDRSVRGIPLRIRACSFSTPKVALESAQLDHALDLPPGTIASESGVERRFHAGLDESVISMAADAIARMELGRLDADTTANIGSIRSKMIAVKTNIITSLMKSTMCAERKLQIRSVSLLIRDIRSPVRLPP